MEQSQAWEMAQELFRTWATEGTVDSVEEFYGRIGLTSERPMRVVDAMMQALVDYGVVEDDSENEGMVVQMLCQAIGVTWLAFRLTGGQFGVGETAASVTDADIVEKQS